MARGDILKSSDSVVIKGPGLWCASFIRLWGSFNEFESISCVLLNLETQVERNAAFVSAASQWGLNKMHSGGIHLPTPVHQYPNRDADDSTTQTVDPNDYYHIRELNAWTGELWLNGWKTLVSVKLVFIWWAFLILVASSSVSVS